VVLILGWVFAVFSLLSSGYFFIIENYFFGIFFFLLACSFVPPFLHFLKQKGISPLLPVVLILFLFLTSYATPFFSEENSAAGAVVYENNQKPYFVLEKENGVEHKQGQQEVPMGATVIHRYFTSPEPANQLPQHLEVTVKINDTAFVPGVIKIPRGATVNWVNEYYRIHIIHVVNMTGGYTSFVESGKLAFGDSFNYRFDIPGEYDYRDLIFNWRGKIIVTP